MNYFRFKWNLSGFDSSGYESETYDRIIFKDGREIVLEGDKTYTTFTGDKGNGIGPSASTVLRGNMTFENACQTHALNPQMDEVWGGWAESDHPDWVVRALKNSTVPQKVKMPRYGGSETCLLFNEFDEE